MMSPVNNKHEMQNKFSNKIITNFKALKICNPFFAVVFFVSWSRNVTMVSQDCRRTWRRRRGRRRLMYAMQWNACKRRRDVLQRELGLCGSRLFGNTTGTCVGTHWQQQKPLKSNNLPKLKIKNLGLLQFLIGWAEFLFPTLFVTYFGPTLMGGAWIVGT